MKGVIYPTYSSKGGGGQHIEMQEVYDMISKLNAI
jgi:hypothetical protein